MRARNLTAALIAVAVAVPPAAAAAEPVVAVRGAPGPGPARYDRVFVQRFGSPRAKRVLILVPGFLGGAGDFRLIARDIVRRVPGLQVWAYDRREQALEDSSVFRRNDPDASKAYYLGFRYRKVAGAKTPYAGRWGLKLALEDLRRVVLRARRGGRRKVILGGHSLGASTAVAYAAWDFRGRPGYRDLSGLVLIDGGLLGSFDSASVAGARRTLAEIRAGKPFADLLGLGVPEAPGLFARTAAQYALVKPQEPSALQDYPLLPPSLKPPVRATNEAAFGYAFDASTSPASLRLIQVNSGGLAAAGDPRPWTDGGLTPIRRLATLFGGQPDGVDWYFPRRLSLDVNAMSPLRPTAATRLLGLRPFHARTIDVPLYAFETNLTGGRVLRGARRLIRASRIRRYTLAFDTRQSHLDPLVAAPARNRFLKTVVPFLRRR